MVTRVGNRNAQSVVEYAVLFAVIVAALLFMQMYLKRGTMGRMRDATDQLGEQFNPHDTQSNFTQGQTSARTETSSADGSSSSAGVSDNQTRTGEEHLQTKLKSENLWQ